MQTNEEAQLHVQDHDLFVTVQPLEETPAVLSVGKPCSEHGYSHEWKNGETPRLTQNGNIINCTIDNFVSLVVPGLSSSSSSSSRQKGQSSSSGESEQSSDPVTTRSDRPAIGIIPCVVVTSLETDAEILGKTEFGKEKGQSGGSIQKGEPHERNPCAPSSEEQPPEETSRQADCISKEAWNLARKYTSSSRT